jgi:predicted porin
MNEKHFLAATCVALGMAGLTTAQAQSSVTINGIADAAARSVSNTRVGSLKSLVSGSNSTSRLIVRGVEDLGGGLSASFHLEHGLALDTGLPTGGFWDRRSTVSLTSKAAGELRLGRDFVPTYVNWSRFDPFSYVGIAGSNNLISGAQQGPIRAGFGTGANTTVRSSNAIQLLLPGGLAGFEGGFIAAAGEGVLERVLGARIGWAGGPAVVSLAHTTSKSSTPGLATFKDTAIAGSYRFGTVRLSGGWREFKQANAKQTNLLLGLVVPLGKHEIKASYGRAEMDGRVGTLAIGANGATQIGLGYVHNLSKRTSLYAHFANMDNEGAASFVIPGGNAGMPGGGTSRGYEFGMRHTF